MLSQKQRGAVAASGLFFALTAHASAQQPSPVSPTTAFAPGWIGLTYTDGDSEEAYRWNTKTGAWAAHVATRGVVGYAEFKDPSTGANEEFDMAIADLHNLKGEKLPLLKRGLLQPEEGENLRARATQPYTFPELLAQAKATFGDDGIKVAQDVDKGMTRYTLEKTDAAKRVILSATQIGESSDGYVKLSFPSTVWVDPKTNLIREIQSGNTHGVLTYNAPPATSAYDIGAPRNARVADGTPAKETLAIFNRMMGRYHQPPPDGVIAELKETQPAGKPILRQLTVYGFAGPNWSKRVYKLDAAPGEAGALLPKDWQGADADTFFRNLAATLPKSLARGDGKTLFLADIDPTSGAEMRPSGMGNGVRPGIPGAEERSGAEARVTNTGMMDALYPLDAENAVFVPGMSLEIITSPDRPGLLAFSTRRFMEQPEWVTETGEYWIAPAHDDRPVSYRVVSVSPLTHAVLGTTTTDFSNYATFPAPDGRSYPTTWTEVTQQADKDGKLAQRISVTTTFHYFPGKKLAPIARNPEGLP